jgi:hypothetical protein
VRQSQEHQEVKKLSNDEVKMTPEEEALGKLWKETEGVLSEAAHTLIVEAHKASYAANLASSYNFGPEEYEEAMQKMRLEATRLTDRDREHLAKIVRGCEAAASSIDPDDQTPAGYKVYCKELQWRRYYQMMFSMVDYVLQDD